jgi:hypothetical protein
MISTIHDAIVNTGRKDRKTHEDKETIHCSPVQ